MLKKIAHESVFAKPWFIYPITWAAGRAAQGSLSPASSRALQGHSRSDCQPQRSQGSWLGVCLWVPNPRLGAFPATPPASLCFRTLRRLPSMLLEELIRGKRGGHCPGQALCPQPRIIPMTAPWAAHPGAGSGPPVLPDQSHQFS